MAYYGDFTCKKDLLDHFGQGYGNADQNLKSELEQCKILLAWYGYECYDGQAFVLFERDGKLYEVNGGHCSCFGLEGQWEPERTSVKELRYRMKQGSLGEGSYSDETFAPQLKRILTLWEKSHN